MAGWCCRHIPLLLTGLLFHAHVVAAPANDTPWRVGVVMIGEGWSEMERSCAQSFVAWLVRRGVAAEDGGRVGADAWVEPPRGVPQNRWLVLAAVRLDYHLELLVFRRDPADGTLCLAARQTGTLNKYGSPRAPHGPLSGPGQDMERAVQHLATLVAPALSRKRPPSSRTPTCVSVELGDGVSPNPTFLVMR